uniref:NADH dehydrogenase subunit 6 n=1 Tax=Trifida elongata TaxID=2929027 RepID=UPI002001BEF2|nr:NADH dehydrogenase subunit 6 [Trifida elongata]UNS15671.1 NADH dehydrogenase subunit 6 [Trifida elongata]
MKMMLMKIMMINSSMTFLFMNPMSMGILLLIQTMLMILMINQMSYTSWFMMITFLMMISGLLILFTYMSSIASNEKFKLKINLTLALIIMLIMIDEMMIENQVHEKLQINHQKMIDLSLIKIYNKKSMMLTMMLVIYLLLTMISVSKIVKHHEGPLRASKIYE